MGGVKSGWTRALVLLVRPATCVCAATAAAGIVTLATRSGWIGLSSLAATPKAVAAGKVWLLATSGLVADRPWLPSLLGFVIVGLSAVSIARGRVVLLAALAGHILATLVVYGALGVAHAIDRDAFASFVAAPDFGLSAIIAAWIGVIAAVLWRRHPLTRARVLDAIGCICCALIGFAFRPDVTALDSEHLVAFAFGVAIAAWWPGESGFAADVDRELEELLGVPANGR